MWKPLACINAGQLFPPHGRMGKSRGHWGPSIRLTVFVHCRPRFSLLVDGVQESLPFNNPTAVAIATLCASSPYTGGMLDKFLEAGSIPALLRMLCKTSCPLSSRYALHFIQELMTTACPPVLTTMFPGILVAAGRKIADNLCQAGAWLAWL
jgi:hypothetical protein